MINARTIEAGHGTTVETQRTRRDDEIRTLRAAIAHRRYFSGTGLKEEISFPARSSVPLTPPKIPVATGPRRTRIGIGGVPGFAVDGLNGFQFFL